MSYRKDCTVFTVINFSNLGPAGRFFHLHKIICQQLGTAKSRRRDRLWQQRKRILIHIFDPHRWHIRAKNRGTFAHVRANSDPAGGRQTHKRAPPACTFTATTSALYNIKRVYLMEKGRGARRRPDARTMLPGDPRHAYSRILPGIWFAEFPFFFTVDGNN